MSVHTTLPQAKEAQPIVAPRGISLRWDAVLRVIVLLIGAFAMIAPFAWVIQVAFSGSARSFQMPPQFIPSSVTLQNFANVFKEVPYLTFVRNSFIIAATITVGQLITCPLAAYPFARLNFPGKNVLFIVLLATLMLPVQLPIRPLFILIRQIWRSDT